MITKGILKKNNPNKQNLKSSKFNHTKLTDRNELL